MSEDLLKISHEVRSKVLENAKGRFNKKPQEEIVEDSLMAAEKNEEPLVETQMEKQIPKEVMDKIEKDYNDTILRVVNNVKEELFDINLPFYHLESLDYISQLAQPHSTEIEQKIEDEVDRANAEIRMRAESLRLQSESESVKSEVGPNVIKNEAVEAREMGLGESLRNEIEVEKIEDGEQAPEVVTGSEYIAKYVENSFKSDLLKKQEVAKRKEKEGKKEKRNNVREVSEAEKNLLNELKIAREEYADVQCREMKMRNRLRKALGLKDEIKDEETENIKKMRERYDKALREYKEYRFGALSQNKDEAEFKQGAKELITFFNHDEAIEFYNARTEARINLIDEKGLAEKNIAKKALYGFMSASTKAANFYNKKVPTSAKLALAGLAFLPGAQVLSVGKRAWGAFMMAAAGGMQIDKLAQFKDKLSNSREINKLMDDLSFDKEKEVSFDKLNSILDEKISNIDDKINKHVLRSQINKGIAFASAAFLGTSTLFHASELWSQGLQGNTSAGLLGKIFSHKAENSVGVINEPTAATTDMHDRLGLHSRNMETGEITDVNHQPVLNKELNGGVGQTEGVRSVEGGNIAESKEMIETKAQTVSIKEPTQLHEGGRMTHDSFIKNLKEQLKNYPGIDKDDAGHIAEVTFHDAAKEYAKAHGITYDEAFTKLSKIHPGSTYELTWDAEGHPHVTLDDKNIKFVNAADHNHAAAHHARVGGSAHTKIEPVISDTPTNETYQDWNKDVIDSANRATQEKYDIASAVSRGEVPALDPNSPNFEDNLGYAKTLKDAAASDLYNWGPSYEVGRLGEVMKQSQEHMKSLLDMPDKETFTKIGRDFFDNKKSNILKFGNMSVREALSDPNKNLEGLSEKAKKLIIGYANSDATKPKPNETFKVWSYRIMTLARRTALPKNANPDYFDPTGL